jgi:antitoxin VapB
MGSPERKSADTAKVFMNGRSQAVRLPAEYRFDCDEVAIRRVGRHVILSPRFSDWEDYWAHSARPSDEFVKAICKRHVDELPLEDRATFDE